MSLGYHLKKGEIDREVSFSSAIISAYDSIASYGMRPCLQIFVMGPKNSSQILTAEDKRVLAAWKHRDAIVVHGCYIDIPWSLKPGGIAVLKSELTIASDIGANGVVVHLHPKAHDHKVMKYVLTEIAKLPAEILAGPRIWLENKPVKGGVRHCTPGEVKELFEMIKTINPRPKIGFCIDTQHSFASGIDITDYTPTFDWLDSLREALPDEFPMMIHLNDSKVALGSGLDRHENLCEGMIWKDYGLTEGKKDLSESGITACVLWAEEQNVQVILETPDANNDIKFLRYIGFK